ncbi:phosphomannomutase/phosphoglucomutase [Dermabacter hominis]|uniref:phosphomannomutase/phosphoglucomutase n=1 Tax=Dermabacter hominis TaxID=36740 RepID=UPI0021A3614D|nr:phosphomannomutase/phosphoglucomutase [Dermabacter hominis]MCT1789655.1 phosphomannomutase/phosphoglucomutase [Dermabacter hominis]
MSAEGARDHAGALEAIVGSYDIRGVAYETLTPEIAGALGAAFADFLDAGDIIVAHDMRISSPDLAEAFARGAVRRGSTVAFAGLSSTDQLYCASGLFAAAGAQVTASHNPARDNGIKMCRAYAKPVGRANGLLDVRDGARAYLDRGSIPIREGGRIERLDMLDDYIDTMLRLAPLEGTRQLRVVVDAANAMAGHTVPALAKRLPTVEIIPLFFDLDGTFPHHEANPLDPANLRDLQNAVRENGADLGLAFDGDADRCIVVDERGEIVPPSAVTAMIAEAEIARSMLDGRSRPVVIGNAVSSRAVREVVEASGGEFVRTKVGHSIIKQEMADRDAVFGGEHSAHYYFREFFFADSGMLAALHVLGALERSGAQSLSSLLERYSPYAASGEINSRVDEPVNEILERVARVFVERGARRDDLDGVTLTHWDEAADPREQWWLSVRPSGTEPLVRLNVEAAEEATMQHLRDFALALVRGEAEVLGEVAPHGEGEKESTMSPDERNLEGMDWVGSLVRCPECHASLDLGKELIVCESCGCRYEREGGIPMLMSRDVSGIRD